MTHGANDRFTVTVTAHDRNGEAVGEPLTRTAVEPELAAVVAMGELQKGLEAKRIKWKRLDLSIERE